MNSAGAGSKLRVRSIDALRGLIMIIMALDHTREFFHAGSMIFQPENLSRTTAGLFLTRWITHFCAPVFMFTAGLGAFLWLSRGRTKGELTSYLWKRGLWLVVLEVTALRFATNFSLTEGMVLLTVLWALGWSMIALSLLIHLPGRWLAVLSLAVIALHNLTDSVAAAQFGPNAWIWNLIHQPGVFLAGGVPVLAAYPLVPWVFVMSSGYCFGSLFTLAPERRRQWLLRIGWGLTVAFFALRAINVYGDPVPWSTRWPGMTVLSFLRTTKYPPSLDFLLMTMGPSILLLGWMEKMSFQRTNPLIVFGRVPLFYFIVHFFVIHVLTIPLGFLKYGEWRFLLHVLPSMGGDAKLYPPNYGYELWVVYTVWVSVVVMLYPICLWFSRLKERRKEWWISYL